MNWVGGVRSRIRQQTEKKKQREFFERKRLEAKEKKVVQPRSPEERSVKTISKDLLCLQAVSKAYDRNIDDDEVALSRVKRLKLTGPRSLWPAGRNLPLPMSPIRKPSALEFQEAGRDTDLSSMFTARHVPLVSTQKIPHRTSLNSFGPAAGGASRNRESQHDKEGGSSSTSLWTESVFPIKRGDPEQIGNLSMASSFMNESLGPQKRFSKREEPERKKKTEWTGKPTVMEWQGKPPIRGRVVHRKAHQIVSGLEFPDRKTRRKPLVAEKSFDHETPFNFGPHPLQTELEESPGKELPKTNAALLDFHGSENPVKHHTMFGKDKVQKIKSHVGREEMGKTFAALPEEEVPGHYLMEAQDEPVRETDTQWDTITPYNPTKHSTNTTMTLTGFDENPLSRKAGPKSCSTVFNESVLGPIWRQGKEKKKQKRSSSSPKQPPPPPQALPEPSTAQQRDEVGGTMGSGTNTMSAFEKMMSTFDAYKESVAVAKALPAQQEGDTNGRKLCGGSGEVTLFGTDGGGGTYWECFGAPQNSKGWQDFVSGTTEDPHTAHTAAHKQWQEFTSGAVNGEHNSKDTCQRVPDDNSDCHTNQEIESSSGNGDCHSSEGRKLPSKRARRTSVSVLDELMCLEEIGSAGTPVASQEISFTPMMPSQLVPDIDATKSTGAQRCISENPLKICHTPAHKPRPKRGLVALPDKKSYEDAEKTSVMDGCEGQRVCIESIHEQTVDTAMGEGSSGEHTEDKLEANKNDGYGEGIEGFNGHAAIFVNDALLEKANKPNTQHDNDRNLEIDVPASSPTLPTPTEAEQHAIAASHQLESSTKLQGVDEGLQKDDPFPQTEGAVKYTSIGVQTGSTPNSQSLNNDSQQPGNCGNVESADVAISTAVSADTEPTTPPMLLAVDLQKQRGDEAICRAQGEEFETEAESLDHVGNEALSQGRRREDIGLLAVPLVDEAIPQGQGENIEHLINDVISQAQGEDVELPTLPLHQQVDVELKGERIELPAVPQKHDERIFCDGPTTASRLQQSVSIGGEVEKDTLQTEGALKCVSVGVQTDSTITPAKPQLVPLSPIPPAGPIFPFASVAVQCSFPLASSSLSLQERSTQTLTATHKDTAVQTREDRNMSGEAINSDMQSTGAGELADARREPSALQKELETVQNTVIWQALMLRLYSEH